MRRILGLYLLVFITMSAAAETQDSVGRKHIEASMMTEVNYGRHYGNPHTTIIDFPHVLLNIDATLGKGWSAVAELEYERFYSDGEWDNNFRGNYTTNKFYLNKCWSPRLNLKLGIVDIPVGTTNSGGPALTIYDPLSESKLMPMTWHEGGMAVWGCLGRWHYEVGGYCYPACPLRDSRMLGGAMRVGVQPIDGLDVSASCFVGSSKEGMIQRQNPYLATFSHVYHAALDFSYLAHGWTIDGQMIACSARANKSAGIEAGYDCLNNIVRRPSLASCSAIVFARFDGYFHVESVSCNKWSVGFNSTLPLGFTFKAEAAWINPSNARHLTTVDVSVGWQGTLFRKYYGR